MRCQPFLFCLFNLRSKRAHAAEHMVGFHGTAVSHIVMRSERPATANQPAGTAHKLLWSEGRAAITIAMLLP